jgi:hypothetical protein
MISADSKNNRLIRLTDERIGHILKNHPEMKTCISWMIETIKEEYYGNSKYCRKEEKN